MFALFLYRGLIEKCQIWFFFLLWNQDYFVPPKMYFLQTSHHEYHLNKWEVDEIVPFSCQPMESFSFLSFQEAYTNLETWIL